MAASKSLPSRRIRAPYERVASCLAREARSGITIVEAIPSVRAASATPCAWFPAEAAITPRRRSSGERWERQLKAPRILNEPVFWRFSSLRKTGTPARRLSERDGTIGVRSAESRIFFKASSISRNPIDIIVLPIDLLPRSAAPTLPPLWESRAAGTALRTGGRARRDSCGPVRGQATERGRDTAPPS